jgi:DNA-binding MarR family transcriptional regulator
VGGRRMKFSQMYLSKPAFIYGAIFSLANRMQTLGDRVDPSVSQKQWFVLATVSVFDDGSPNIGDIAKILGTSRQNIKKIAVILEKKGYLKLEKNKNDLRSIHLLLTDSCYEYFKSREQQENEYIEAIFHDIDDDLINSLCAGMSKLIKNIDCMVDGV